MKKTVLTQTDLSNLNKDDSVDHYLVIRKIEVRTTKNGSNYLSLELGDRSLSVNSNIWDNFESIYKNFKAGDIVKIKGSMDDYRGIPQINISSIKSISESEKVSVSDFLPKSKRDPEKMKKEFFDRIEKISDHNLRTLITNVFNEDNFRKFFYSPAGKSWHHAYIHGLIEHTLEIIKICDLMCDIHFEINRDLLIGGAVMHDFGKTEELSIEASFNYTDKGKLLGHIVISAMLINEETKKIPGFPEELKNNLLHIVLSHQGKLEFASPVVPKTLEAITLYQADELSAKVNAYKNALYSEIKGDNKWTRFITLAATDLYQHNLSQATNNERDESLFD
jgi:3'-5' exoribonuclease